MIFVWAEKTLSFVMDVLFQCSEVEILESLVCWGENELVKRMEEREPNLVANTTHSISRRGVRRSDLNDQELKLILSSLLPLVRTDYILPPFHQVLLSVICLYLSVKRRKGKGGGGLVITGIFWKVPIAGTPDA